MRRKLRMSEILIGETVITLKRILTNGFFILVLYLVIITGVVVFNEMGNVAADAPANSSNQIAAPVENPIPDRDITQQRFAPLTPDQ